MTEEEWLVCTDPGRMLEFILGKAGDRKLRLFACAYARQLWAQLDDERCKHAVEIAEQYADGVVNDQDREKAWQGAFDVVVDAVAKQEFVRAKVVVYAKRCIERSREQVVRLDFHFHPWRPVDVNLVKDIFGNPFHPVALDPSGRTPKIVALAQEIYDNRACDRLSDLADALEAAGCDNQETLTHCRGPGPHVRGCWVVDLFLGKG